MSDIDVIMAYFERTSTTSEVRNDGVIRCYYYVLAQFCWEWASGKGLFLRVVEGYESP